MLVSIRYQATTKHQGHKQENHQGSASLGQGTDPHQLLHVTVLGRALERLQHKEQSDGEKFQRQARRTDPITEQHYRGQRKQGGPAKDTFLGELVGKIARGRYKQHAGQQEQQVQHVELPRARCRIPHAAKDEFRVGDNRGRNRHLCKSQTKKREKAFDLFHSR